MKYLVTFHDEACLCIDEAMFDADTPGELHKKCEEYVRTNLRDYSVAGSKYYKYLECSTKGDKRYSAFCAQITINGKTDSIEHFYQTAKRLKSGEIAGKGNPFDYFICPFCGIKFPPEEVANLYKGLWIVYYNIHPELVSYAKQFDIFNDMFKGKSKNCQADVIRDIVHNKDNFEERVRGSLWYKIMSLNLLTNRK